MSLQGGICRLTMESMEMHQRPNRSQDFETEEALISTALCIHRACQNDPSLESLLSSQESRERGVPAVAQW